jgi:hypothetical protein
MAGVIPLLPSIPSKAYTNTHNFLGYKTAQSDSALDTCTEVKNKFMFLEGQKTPMVQIS